MAVLNALLEMILDDRGAAVSEAGATLLRELSGDQILPARFLEDPLCLTAPPFLVPRYLAQVTLRALRTEYESIEDLAQSLQAFLDRNPAILEPGRQKHRGAVIPEARVVELRQPARQAAGHWEAGIVAMVTSGPLNGREIEILIDSRENRLTCFLVPSLWLHASISIYNLSVKDGTETVFTARSETFLVIEPLRQINVTSIARSLHCTKPQLDQMRRGKGDTTIQTLKGTIVHGVFDRMLEGNQDLEKLCDDTLAHYGIQVASVVDDFFDETAFRADVMRHLASLRAFIDAHPNVLEDPQIELKRYSATIGIQGRIDALFRQGSKLDILELKTGSRIRVEDHAQLFIYRLLLSDMIRRWQRDSGKDVEITARLLSSVDGAFAPLDVQTDFYQVMDARNRLLATQYALSLQASHFKFRYEGFNEEVCGLCVSWVRKRCKESTAIFSDRPGTATTPQLDYFNRFTRLLERERWSVDQEIADLLDDSRTESRRKNFRALLDVRIVPDAEPFTFEFAENTSDLETGAAVLIHCGDISSMPIYHGYVRDIEMGRLRVSIPLKNLKPAVFENQSWIIDRFPSDVTTEASHTALYDFLVSPNDTRKAAILGQGDTDSPSRKIEPAAPELSGSGLNDSQVRAIQRAASCSVYHLIWGPPGTGKTKVIPEIVRRISGRVLLGAFTNTAVDKMLMALLTADPSVRFLRIGRASDSPELASLVSDPAEYFSEDLALKHRGIHAIRRALDAAPIVAATAHRACTMPYLRQRAFEMVLVDEAGQLTEPLTLGLILRGRRFVLVGDDRQLPPVVRTRGLARSMFERMKGEVERTHSGDLTLLDIQYRMHPQIMSVSNHFFYDGRLRSGVSGSDLQSPDGSSVTLISVSPIAGPAAGEKDQSDARVNLTEAEAVARLARQYCRSGISPGSIGVISPFRAQVVLLRKLLRDTGVTVDTVERFQGGERDIIMLSFVRAEGRGFVFDERRFNVAITRARRKLVLFAHPELFRNSRYEWICTFTETPRIVGTT